MTHTSHQSCDRLCLACHRTCRRALRHSARWRGFVRKRPRPQACGGAGARVCCSGNGGVVKQAWICTICGTQYEPSEQPAACCSICDEQRQFVLPTGQQWTSLAQLRKSHMATFRREGELIGIG